LSRAAWATQIEPIGVNVMADDDPQSNYDKLDVLTLTNLLINPEKGPHVHQRALSAMSHLNPEQRRSRMITVMRNIARMPERYDEEVVMSVAEILATDPDPEATQAMIEVLLDILKMAMTNRDALSAGFRTYFYEALVTRTRDGDLEIWAELLPQFTPPHLVAMVLDPAAGPLQALDPVTLMDRLDEPERTRALTSALVGLLSMPDREDQFNSVMTCLQRSAEQGPLEQGLEKMAKRWENSKKAGNSRLAATAEQALVALDKRPRTAAEKLRGRRPWAP
jgi:hypothetical protein